MTEFKTIAHFRELGGLKTKEGKRIRNGYFYRCGELSHLSQEEKKKLDSLNINKVFDLRRPSEVQKSPDYQGNFTYIHKPMSSDDPKRDRLFMDKGEFIDRFTDYDESKYNYLICGFANGYMHNPYNTECLKPILMSLDEHRPILFHCFAGKDRTGVTAMIISAALGCDYETCKADYMRHNTLIDEEAKLYRRLLAERNANEWGIRAFIEANSAKEMWFDCAWNSIFSSYRCIEDYLKEELEITQQQIDDWRHFYLEG